MAGLACCGYGQGQTFTHNLLGHGLTTHPKHSLIKATPMTHNETKC
jgi:hypothetical protein